MVRVNVFNLVTLALTFLSFLPKMESQIRRPQPVIPMPPPPARHPLCGPQLALVAYACARVPFTPGAPPPPVGIDIDDEGYRSHHEHGHRHGHHHHDTPQEDNCCRWAKEMDSRCVCEILIRLPIFLTRPLHQYSVMIGESCKVTYTCGGPI